LPPTRGILAGRAGLFTESRGESQSDSDASAAIHRGDLENSQHGLWICLWIHQYLEGAHAAVRKFYYPKLAFGETFSNQPTEIMRKSGFLKKM
jgi:hypothetical protein